MTAMNSFERWEDRADLIGRRDRQVQRLVRGNGHLVILDSAVFPVHRLECPHLVLALPLPLSEDGFLES